MKIVLPTFYFIYYFFIIFKRYHFLTRRFPCRNLDNGSEFDLGSRVSVLDSAGVFDLGSLLFILGSRQKETLLFHQVGQMQSVSYVMHCTQYLFALPLN